MNNNTNPLVSVLLPVYNCEKYIVEAIQSILRQTYTHFELLIIDDCSTDATLQICKSFQDDRIVIIEKEKNSGYTTSLNYGLSIAKGKYIARMDGDDISLLERFEKQVAFMETNKEVVVCGTLYQIIGSNRICNHPSSHEAIKVKLITGCYLAHPTVMIRGAFFKVNNIRYDEAMEPAEDYDLWSKIVFIGNLANLDEVLLHYRVHESQTSNLRSNKQIIISKNIKLRMLQKLLSSLSDEDLFLFNNQKTQDYIKKTNKLLSKLKAKNEIKKIYDTVFFTEFIKDEKHQLVEYFYNNKNKISLFHRLNIFFSDIQIFKILGLKKSLTVFLK